MNLKRQKLLQTQLLLSHTDASPEEYQKFFTHLIEHRFRRLLSIYGHKDKQQSFQTNEAPLPLEHELNHLLQSGHPELFFKNVLYHLGRTLKKIPTGIVPTLLTLFKNHPTMWSTIYAQHPELTLALSRNHGTWNYILRAFDHKLTLAIGSPGYYDALKVRMEVLPLPTFSYIKDIYPKVSAPQQARLLDILHKDLSPDVGQFIETQLSHSRKPVRLAALNACVLRKVKSVYDPLKNELLKYIKAPQHDDSLIRLPPLLSWKDLEGLGHKTTKTDILIALVDPDDYLNKQSKSFQSEHQPALIEAATLHRSQKTLSHLAQGTPSLLHDSAFVKALDGSTALDILKIFIDDPHSSFDQKFINLLKKIHPFLNESDSDLVWQRFVKQWAEMPFTVEELALEVLALRIHPNRIRPIWQHPLLQDTAPPLQKIRDILKNRLELMKKCYA